MARLLPVTPSARCSRSLMPTLSSTHFAVPAPKRSSITELGMTTEGDARPVLVMRTSLTAVELLAW